MIYMNMETAKIMVISKPGFRIRKIVAGGPRSFGIGFTYKWHENSKYQSGTLSTPLQVIGFRD